MIPLHADLCIRCEEREPALGSFFCEPCQRAMAEPRAPRPEQGKPVARRLGPQINRRFNQKPIVG